MNNECIVCGGVETTPLFRTHDRHYGVAGEFDLVRCTSCGLVHLDPIPTEAQLAGFYSDTYYAYVPPSRSAWWKRIFAAIFRFEIRTHNPAFAQPGQFLDVGCGNGAYLHVMAKHGWQVHGVEPSPAGAVAGRNAGLDIFQGTLLEANFPDSSFDYIRSNHSFEHVPNPVAILQEIYRILRPGGKLFIGIPNIDSLNFRLFGRYWWYLGAPLHTYSYSTATITRLLKHTHFNVERVFYNSNFWSLLGSFQIYMNRNTGEASDQGFKVRSVILRILATLAQKCIDFKGQGDAIEVICEKPLS